DFDLASGQIRVLVPLRTPDHLTGDLHAELVAQRVCQLDAFAEHHLHDPRGVPQIDENDTAVVAPAGYPTGEGHRRAGVRRAQAAGVMGTDPSKRLLFSNPGAWPA